MAEYHRIAENLLRQKVPSGYRPCTILEWKKFDRTIFRDILAHLKRGEGSMAEGLKWFLTGDGRKNPTWQLLDMKL
eukprot:8003217-Karenia_brevis.AAC.1